MNESQQDNCFFAYLCSMPSYINAISTAVPEHKFDQSGIVDFMIRCHNLTAEESGKLASLYKATGITTRHSVLEDYGLDPKNYTFYPRNENLEPFPGTARRMEAYRKYALPLALKAVEGLNRPDRLKHITHLIVVSCTGMYAPGLDIEIIRSMGLPTSVRRTAVNFMGCYAAFNAIKIADAICRSENTASVLVVCLELCTLHFQKGKTEVNMLANSLFSDGCAAVLIDPEPLSPVSLKLLSFYSDLALDAGSDMTWNIADTGFEMVLTAEIPAVIKNGIKQLAENLFRSTGLTRSDIDFYAIHPGGRKILEVIEEELSIGKPENIHAYQVLRDFGNMSSPTILFVLKSLVASLNPGNRGCRVLSFAFGPGLTLESMLMQITGNHEQ